MKKLLCYIIFALVVILSFFTTFFYPQQLAETNAINAVVMLTPIPDVYHNDCLHPCIRYSEKKFGGYRYWMVQTPYYGWNNMVENPILYCSNSLDSIGIYGVQIAGTPTTGYNSDPNIFIDGDSVLFVFWRECGTPLCDSFKMGPLTVGVFTRDGVTFSEKKIYLANQWNQGDTEQAPTLIKHYDEYCFYASWYAYEPARRNKGIAIWRSKSLIEPNFVLTDTIPFETIFIPDKVAEVRVDEYHIYCPKPQSFDLWHFDLWEKENGDLGIVACAEKGDAIILGTSNDWKHFKLNRKPLVMNHFMQNHIGYRQYYYKPTAVIDSAGTHYFWTSNSKEDPTQNMLWHFVD